MTKTQPHAITCDIERGAGPKRETWEELQIATVHPASQESVDLVMSAPEGGYDGRSEHVWLRLENGDLILGVFPRGDTYFAVEVDASYPA